MIKKNIEMYKEYKNYQFKSVNNYEQNIMIAIIIVIFQQLRNKKRTQKIVKIRYMSMKVLFKFMNN